MFHDPHFDPAKTDAWQQHLARGHVVLFRFPIRLPGEGETAKPRPCLVLDTLEFAGSRYAVIAYGTSANSRTNRGYDIAVKGDEATAAGLDRDTRFVGARRISVPLAHPGFLRIKATDAPVIGRLQCTALQRMNAVRARIFAEADIAAERRAECRRESRRRRTRRKPFEVVRSAPKRLCLPRERTGS